MRKFTRYPSNYVKADTTYREVSDAEFDKLVDSYKGERSWSLIVAELKGTYGLDMAKKVADAVIEGSSCIKANTINISGWLDRGYEEPAYTSGHWEAIAEFDDGSRLEFTKPYTANGNYALEEEQQYNIECELLDKATATGKEVVFYTVNFVGKE